MNRPTLGILITSYNDDRAILNRCIRSAYEQDYENLFIVCIDDGSDVPVSEVIDFPFTESRLQIKRIRHSERSVSRDTGLEVLREKGADYFVFIDSDMVLPAGFASRAVDFITGNKCTGVVIPEVAFSQSDNYWTRVKVFERNLYQAVCPVNRTSIEAARLWDLKNFPGFCNGLNAFEEIQPTINCINSGGRVCRTADTYILHDEKHVSLGGLLKKKSGYFSVMGDHRAANLGDMFTRFYFFRPQLYTIKNIKSYFSHPLLFLGVVLLYTALSASATVNIIRGRCGRC
ncbi:MAG: glycosyltransferase family 2 protein [Bacillota bacterium]